MVNFLLDRGLDIEEEGGSGRDLCKPIWFAPARRRLTIREPTHIFGEHTHQLRYGHKKESSVEANAAPNNRGEASRRPARPE